MNKYLGKNLKIGIFLVFWICSSVYTQAQIPTKGLVAYYPFAGNTNDQSGSNLNAVNHNASLISDRFGRASHAYLFNGIDQYLEIPSDSSLSIAHTGSMSISVWLRPDTLNFEKNEKGGYVHWIGKGISGYYEWTFRMYNLDSERPNRMSCYAFNLAGGLGAGSYVQEFVNPGKWIHLVAIFNYPANMIRIYKNGELEDRDFFSDYSIEPHYGQAPLRIGTRDFNSYFKGAIDDIRIYNRVLTDGEIQRLFGEK